MTFRVPPHRQVELSLQQTQNHYAESARLQNQIGSGKRIHRPSDDPQGQRTILNQQRLVARLETQVGSISRAGAIANQANNELLEANRLIVQAKGLALEARQSTETSDLRAIATEIDGYLKTMETIANARFDGLVLFGGASTIDDAYAQQADGPAAYQGDLATGQIVLAEEGEIPVHLTGRDVFRFDNGDGGPPQDMFALLRGLRDDLRARETMTGSEWGARIDARIESLEGAGEHLLEVIGRHSTTLQRLERLQTRAEDLLLGARQVLSDTQSPDFAEAVIKLQEEQNLLQFGLSTVARIFEVSVLDYLR